MIGLGAGIAFNPILLAAMSGVGPTEFGLASGIVNTSFMMGGALGLAVLASAAAARTDSLTSSGESELEALNGGYHLAFMIGAAFTLVGALVAAAFIRAEAPVAGGRAGGGGHGGRAALTRRPRGQAAGSPPSPPCACSKPRATAVWARSMTA